MYLPFSNNVFVVDTLLKDLSDLSLAKSELLKDEVLDNAALFIAA